VSRHGTGCHRRGARHRGLERLPEAVHVDQNIAAAGLREKTATLLGHRLDRIETPIVEPDRGEREAAIVRRRQLRPGDGHRGRPLRPEPGLGAPAVHGLSGGGNEERGVDRERRRVEPRAGAHRVQAGTSAERERARRGCEPAQECATRSGLMLQQTPGDHAQPSRTPGLTASPRTRILLNHDGGEKREA
jgi:hypothetical protein